MADVTKDPNYMEGQWAGRSMVKHIEKTEYGDLETALEAKQDLIDDFKKHFGWTEDGDKWNSDFARTLGMVNILKEAYEEQQKRSEETDGLS